ncbi:unnamed protein product [Meloidogyne enterolobii]|uniref:Uncharacterized protein n=1 Tax=Meloidogyne enterolobii TaxID=390850 RepID=A0ACB0ZDX0_MELEN
MCVSSIKGVVSDQSGSTGTVCPYSFLPFATFIIVVFTIRINVIFYSCIILFVTRYQSRVAFALLNKVLADFSDRIPQSSWALIQSERDCNYDQLPMFLTKWQNPREADALTRVQDEVEETKVVLHNTMQSVLERGEKLDDLIKASENLSDQSKMFYTQARKMNRCCNYV